MEPAAPVTITVFPRKFSMISLMEIFISWRPSRSSILISLTRLRTRRPPTISSIVGEMSTFILLLVAYLTRVSWHSRASSSFAKSRPLML